MKKIVIDFETQSEFDLRRGGAAEYSAHPTTRVLCMAYKGPGMGKPELMGRNTMTQLWSRLPTNFKKAWQGWVKDPEMVFVAHNATFEQFIYKNILMRLLGWPPIPIEKWRCSAAKAAAVAIPRNLADAGAVMRTRIQKDFDGYRAMMKLCKPTNTWARWNKTKIGSAPAQFWTPKTAPDDFQTLYKYCVIDVESEELLDEALPDLTPFEQKLWFIDQKINMNGVRADMELVDKISKIMTAEQKAMGKELDVLTLGLVVSGNARNAILDFLAIEGLEMPDLKAKTVQDFLENGKATGDAKKILEIRRALSKSSTAKYNMFKLRAGTDGRVRDLFMYCGASRTGRWSGKGLQPQNFPRGIIKDIYEAINRINTCSVDELKLLYGENLMPLFSSVLRGMFFARPGYELHVQDYNAIECRVLWWLAGHEAGLQMFRDGRCPYWEMAKAIYNLPRDLRYNENDEDHVAKRQVGKAATLGCGYQLGYKKFVTAAWDVYRAKVDKDMARIAVTKYRETHYPVTELWEQYQNAAIFAVENPGQKYKVGRVRFFMDGRFLKIELPSGRKLSYCDPKIYMGKTIVMQTPDGEVHYASNTMIYNELIEMGATKQNEFLSKRLTYFEVNQMAKKSETVIPKWAIEMTYGGKLVEGVTQAVARDILAEAISRQDIAGYDVLMHSHDEITSETPIGKFSLAETKKIMEQLPKWAGGLPLKSSGWIDTRYRK